jgi:hypothetical protein
VGRDLPAAVWRGGSVIDHVGQGCELSTASGANQDGPADSSGAAQERVPQAALDRV